MQQVKSAHNLALREHAAGTHQRAASRTATWQGQAVLGRSEVESCSSRCPQSSFLGPEGVQAQVPTPSLKGSTQSALHQLSSTTRAKPPDPCWIGLAWCLHAPRKLGLVPVLGRGEASSFLLSPCFHIQVGPIRIRPRGCVA